MRITVKPPSSPPPDPPIPNGALLTVRVETADPAPLLAGPPTVAYEGRYAADPAPGVFLFPAPAKTPGPTTATSATNPFRTPPTPVRHPHVDIPAREGDVVTATLTTPAKTYSAALTVPAAPHNTTPVEMALVEGGAAPPPPPPPPQPAPGLTITPRHDDPDVLTLDPAPGNDNIVVVG